VTYVKALVTGGDGLIGSHTARLMWDRGYPVTVLYRELDERSAPFPWDVIQGDLVHESTLKKLGAVEFDVVVHCAAVLPEQFYGPDAEHTAQTNLLIDERVIGLCRTKESCLVYMSSSSVYGLCKGSLLTEQTDLSPIGPYAEAKAQSEARVLDELPRDSTILRISAPYGPGQRNRTVLRVFIERALANLDLTYHGSGNRQQDFTAAVDVADAVFCVISSQNSNGIFNIAGGAPISMHNLAELVVKAIPGTKSKVVPSGQRDPQEEYRAAFDTSKARKQLGWYPTVSLEDGIRHWAQYLRGQG
jgi:UDP-glucuronate decarboxylase